MFVQLLTEHHLEFLSLNGGCSGSSESIHVKMSHCWKFHVAAQIMRHALESSPSSLLCAWEQGRFWLDCTGTQARTSIGWLFSLRYQGSHRLEKNLNLEGSLEKSLKIKSALMSTGKSLKSLEKSLNSTIFCRT